MLINSLLKTSVRIVNVQQHRIILGRFSTKPQKQEKQKIKRRMDTNLKIRENPVVLKLDGPNFNNILTDEVNSLVSLFKKYDHEIRIAGGAVRDLLLGKKPTDLDFATTATPEQMKEMFTTENVRMINMNGEKHGTITPRINDRENFEVTTLRIDVLTDGRHAEVEFTKDWLLDANRRDLTVNAMFLGFDGSVYDYFFGYEDLMDRKVQFVGNTDTRIKEDYLRILRYFRFYGKISKEANLHSQETINIITQNVAGLKQISGERIWLELKKTLYGNFAGDLVLKLLECGDVAKYIGLPEKPNITEFTKLWKQKPEKLDYNPITLLTALLHSPEEAIKIHERLKLSAYERDLAYFITQNREVTKDIDELIKFQQMCLQTLGKPRDLQDYVEELLKYHGKFDLYEKLHNWKIPIFPIDGQILMQHGCPSGKLMGAVIRQLKQLWVKEEFRSSKEEILELLPGVLQEFNIVDGKQVKKAKI